MKNPFFERRCRYSIRKLSVGACSLMIGAVLFVGPALAEETAVPENSGANTELVSGESEHSTNEADKQNEGEHTRENKLEKAEGVATASETAEAASAAKPEEKASEVVAETPSAEAKPKSDKETEAKPEATNQGDESKPAAEANKTEKEVQPDVPKNTEKTLKPKEIKFNSWEELLKWEPGAREDDAINRGSVVLASRRTGHLVNEKASKEAKVQALSNTNSKAKDHASVGGEEFKAYAFDY
ncbi:endo-beta-N-acetylglucosaminidase [Streptococcus pneumoniae]|nr:endo-beta-N-acetylglucosaminidase [Streptococcus pneumoniae]